MKKLLLFVSNLFHHTLLGQDNLFHDLGSGIPWVAFRQIMVNL